MSLKPAVLVRLRQIVEAKNWKGIDRQYHPRDTIEDLIARLLERLTDLETDLTLDLIEDYLLIPDYGPLCWDLLDLLVSAGVSEAILCPVKLEQHHVTKSGESLLYELSAASSRYDSLDFQFSDDPLGSRFLFSYRSKIIVDDFIGSGDQFFEMMDQIHDREPNLKVDHLVVIAIQAEAKLLIEATGVDVHALHVRPKAIPELSRRTARDVAIAYSIYDGMERKVPADAGYERGYGASEALITLKRTPDNTLPIFWSEGDGKWPAPFPR